MRIPKLIKLIKLFLFATFLAVPFVHAGQNNLYAKQETGQELIVEAAKDTAQNKIDDVTKTVDDNISAQEATDSILRPIEEAGSYIASIPGFYWIAFAMMAAGFVSFLGQLVLGKLIMLAQFRFSLTEILSDALGLAISVIGLVLLTQAAEANGSFVNSPTAVLTSTAVGAFFGLIFYIRGQTQELREVRALRQRN